MRDFKEASIIIKKKIGERFRQIRERAGHSSARSAADALGVSANTVGELERGENWLSPEIIARAIVAFNVPMTAFFGDQEPISPTPQEALAVIARELETRRETPARDLLAERVARLSPQSRQYVEDLVQGLEDSPPSPEPDQHPPQKRK